MSEKVSRRVPIITGLLWVGVAVAIMYFWPPPDESLWYWVRAIVIGLPMFFGLDSLKRGFFASDEEIKTLMAGKLWPPR